MRAGTDTASLLVEVIECLFLKPDLDHLAVVESSVGAGVKVLTKVFVLLLRDWFAVFKAAPLGPYVCLFGEFGVPCLKERLQ